MPRGLFGTLSPTRRTLSQTRRTLSQTRRTFPKPTEPFPKPAEPFPKPAGRPTEVQVVVRRLLEGGCLDRVGQEAEDGAQPQEHGEPAKEVLAKLDPFRRRRGRRQLVGAVPVLVGLGLGRGEAGLEVGAQPLAQLLGADLKAVIFSP